MRADRLIALLMLLQRRGSLTAAEAAEELEVSRRTARRDLEALAMSGVPVYSQAGRGGGWRLVGGARTDLTGLSADESRALFLAAGPALESTPELRSALRKLTTALPENFRAEAEAAAAAIKVDPTGWGTIARSSPPTHLNALTTAVVEGRQVDLDYDNPRSGRRTRVVHPLGLVTKRNVWYLVADTADGGRTFRLGRVMGVTLLDEPVVRPADFDLDETWDRIVTEVESRRSGVTVKARVRPDLLRTLTWQFGSRVSVEAGSSEDWVEVTLEESGTVGLAAQIAGYGNGIELLDSDDAAAVRAELGRIARELGELYPAAG